MTNKSSLKVPFDLSDIEKISRVLCVPLSDLLALEKLMKTNPDSIVRFFKKRVKKKERTMCQVHDRYSPIFHKLNRLLQQISLPPNFFGSAKKRSQVNNAARHVGHKYVNQIDIRNFFPSLTFRHVRGLFIKLGASSRVAGLLSHLCTYKNCLPQGFSTSPIIASLFTEVFIYEPFVRLFPGLYMVSFLCDDVSISSYKPIVEEHFASLFSLVEGLGLEVHRGKVDRSGPRENKLITGMDVGEKLHAPALLVSQVEADLYLLSKHSPKYVAFKLREKRFQEKFQKATRSKQMNVGESFLNSEKGRLAYIFSVDSVAAGRIWRRYRPVLWTHRLVSTRQLRKAKIIP